MQFKSVVKIGLGGFVVLLVAITILLSFYTNNEYERGIVTRFGEITAVTGPGLNFKTPFVEAVHKADLRIQKDEYKINVYTIDGQPVDALITVNHRISGGDEKTLKRLYNEFGATFDYESRVLRKQAVDRVKGVIGRINVTDLTNERDKVRVNSLDAARKAAAIYNIDVVDLQISDIQYSKRYIQKVEEASSAKAEVERARQEKRQVIEKSEAIRIAAKANADKAIEEARGRAQSRKLQADATAYAIAKEREAEASGIRLIGQARAEALQKQAEALKAAPGLIEFTRAEAMKNWKGDVPRQMIPGAAIPFMDVGNTRK